MNLWRWCFSSGVKAWQRRRLGQRSERPSNQEFLRRSDGRLRRMSGSERTRAVPNSYCRLSGKESWTPGYERS